MKNKWYYLILIILLTGCFNDNKSVSMNIPFNPEKLDPQKTLDSNSKFILSHIFEGLTTEDAKGKVVPAVAESWKVEGTKWTFYINPQAKWQNGKKVKAQDFVIAWERVISPINENENASKMFMIKNAMEYNQSKVSFDYVGIKALDERTLIVELNEEISNFDNLLTQTIFYPLNTEFYESHGKNYGLGEKNILGNGPYRISEWKNSKAITLGKSKKYINKEKIKIEKINFLISGDEKGLKELYKNNKIDLLNLSQEEIMNEKDNKSFHTGEISFLQFNVNEKIFSNKKIRKAIALSIDRKKYNEQFFYGKGDVAESFVPQNITGKEKSFRDEYNQKSYGISYEPNNAKGIFLEGLEELGMNLADIKNITLLVRSTEQEIVMGDFIKSHLLEVLGLNIAVKSETSQMREQIINSGDYSFTMDYFSSDTSEALGYLSKWVSGNYRNTTGWKNEKYNDLIAKATREKEYNKKIDFLHEAEKLLLEELPIVPMTFLRKNYVVKNTIKNIRLSNLTGELDFRYATMEE